MDRKRISVAERRARALDLRGKGYSLRAIARELGMSGPEAARKLVDGALRDVISPKVEELRAEIDERSRLMLEQLAPVAFGKRVAADRRFAAMDRIIRIDRELRQLHGLDAPQATVQLTAEMPSKDVRQELLDRLARLAESAAASEGDRQPERG